MSRDDQQVLVDGLEQMFEVYVVWLPPLLGTPILPLVTALKPLSGGRSSLCIRRNTLAIVSADYMKPAPLTRTSKSPWG